MAPFIAAGYVAIFGLVVAVVAAGLWRTGMDILLAPEVPTQLT